MTIKGNVFVIFDKVTKLPVKVIQDGRGFDANYYVVGIVNDHNKKLGKNGHEWDWNCVRIHDSKKIDYYCGERVPYNNTRRSFKID